MRQTPLHYAVRHSNSEIVQILIQAGCDINLSEKYLHCDTQNLEPGRVSSMEVLTSTDSEKSGAMYVSDGYSALHWAADKGDDSMVDLLIMNGADVNKPVSFDKHIGVTPLHLASQDGHIL